MTILDVPQRREFAPEEPRIPSVAALRASASFKSLRGTGCSSALPALDVLVEEIADLRPLSPTAAQVLQIAEGEHFSAHELAQAISSDPALTARVLRAANSEYYGFPRRITTVRDAVVLLGFRQVRSAVLAACAMRSLPTRETINPDSFWRHALTVGMLAEMLARSEHQPTESAFTAGVLHNVGRLALDQARPVAFRQAVDLARRDGIPLADAERRLFGFTDAELGGALALRWDFPPDLALAIAQHSMPVSSICRSQRIAVLVAEARAFARSRGITDGVDPCETADAPFAVGSALEPLVDDLGGFASLLDRAAVFVEHAAAVP